jgi:hypothetical protein
LGRRRLPAPNLGHVQAREGWSIDKPVAFFGCFRWY